MTTRRSALQLLVLLCIVTPAMLYAHARLERSDPPANARLARVPREIRLTFTEAPESAVSSLSLIGPDSQSVSLGAIRVPTDSLKVLVAEVLGRMREGSYLVRWRTATADGHPLNGAFRFIIEPGAEGLATGAPAGDTTRPAATADTAPAAAPVDDGAHDVARSIGYVIIRWVTLASLVLSIAAPAFVVLVLPRLWTAGDDLSGAVAPAARERVRRVGVVAAAALLLTGGARLSAQSIALHGVTGAMDPARLGALLTATVWGHAWILQSLSAVVLLMAVILAGRRPGAWKLALALCLPLAIGTSLSGHAAAAEAGVALAVTLDTLHVLGAATWIGGLAVLIVAAIPSPAASATRPAAVSALVNAFSPVALACGGLVVVSGVIAATLHFNAPGELFTTDYGRVLLAKIALVIAALSAGAFNWRRVRPALARGDAAGTLRRSASLELAAATLILLVTAILVATAPPR
jgi:putative copper export protein/methionine-rich copper-binding protein CopC